MEDSSSAAMGIMPSVDPMGAVDAVVGALAAKWGVARDRKSVGAHLKRRVSARVGRVLANFGAGVKRRVPAEGVSEGLCADLLIGGFPSAMSGIDGSRYLLASIGSSIAGGRKGKDDDKAGERDAKSTKSASGTTADAESNGPVDSSETSDGDGDVVDESIEDKAGQQCGSEAKGQGEPSVSPSAMAGSVSSLGGSGQGASSAADAGSGDASQTQERILISEIEVKGASPELRTVANQSLVMKPNFAYTLKEVQEDVNRVFSTGYFSSCHPVAEDTRDGVRLTIEVKENPKLTGVVATGADMLPQSLIEEAFEDQVRTPPTPIQFSTHSPSILPSLQSGSGTRADDSRPLLLTRAHPNSVASLSLSAESWNAPGHIAVRKDAEFRELWPSSGPAEQVVRGQGHLRTGDGRGHEGKRRGASHEGGENLESLSQVPQPGDGRAVHGCVRITPPLHPLNPLAHSLTDCLSPLFFDSSGGSLFRQNES